MLARPLADGIELSALEPWQAIEFADHVEQWREHLAPWVPFGRTIVDVDSATELLQRYADSAARDGGRLYGIRMDGKLVGGTLYRIFDPASRVCEIGVWLSPEAQGRGLVTKAAQLMVDWAFDVRGMIRVEWQTMPHNERSIAVARRLGMTRDGVLRQAVVVDSIRRDLEVWSLLSTDPRPWQTS